MTEVPIEDVWRVIDICEYCSVHESTPGVRLREETIQSPEPLDDDRLYHEYTLVVCEECVPR